MAEECGCCSEIKYREIRIPGFPVFKMCDKCISQKVCPQCCGNWRKTTTMKTITVMRKDWEGRARESNQEICNLCHGIGVFDYSSAEIGELRG